MNKNLEKELKLRISMLEAKVEILMALQSKSGQGEQVVLALDTELQEKFEEELWQEEMHNDLLILSV